MNGTRYRKSYITPQRHLLCFAGGPSPALEDELSDR